MATQILTNRELGDFVEGYDNMCSSVPIGYGFVQGPISGTTTATEALMPMYGLGIAGSVFNKVSVKSESGLSSAIPVSRKRSREVAFNHQQFVSVPPDFNDNHHLLNEDFSLNFLRHQSEMDRLIGQHTLKLRLEMEVKKKSYSKRIITAVEDVITKKLRAKDEEIEKISKLNWVLDEKVKSLFLENQIWRELAQTNEATANALRSNLEQVLTHVQEDQQRRSHHLTAATESADDAESCCGSNCGDNNSNNNQRNTNTVDSCLAATSHGGGGGRRRVNGYINRMCRNCGKEEATVLIMPCRHLCLCYLCGPMLHNCPICNSVKNIMVRVNLGC